MYEDNVTECIKLIVKNWKNILFVMIFDALFLLFVMIARPLIKIFNNVIIKVFYNTNTPQTLVILFFLIEIFVLFLVYSFNKYCILQLIQKTFFSYHRNFPFPKGREQNELANSHIVNGKFLTFLKISLVSVIPIILVLALYIHFTSVSFQNFLSEGNSSKLIIIFIISVLAGLILLVYLYTWLNLLHFIFLKEHNLLKILKEALTKSFRLDTYKLYILDLKILFIFIIFILAAYIFFKLFIFTSMPAYLKYYSIYNYFVMFSSFLTAYLLLLFNRINFFLAVQK